jgi:hypothetical protein
MGSIPKISRPYLKQPLSPAQQEQAQHDDALDRQRAEADDYTPGTVEMSPEERAVAEKEKRELAELLRATRPTRPPRERSAPESLSSHNITDFSEVAPERIPDVEPAPAVEAPEVVPAPVLSPAEQEAAQTELQLLEAEIQALQEEQRAAERANAEELKRLKSDADTKLNLIRLKRIEAEGRAHDARQAAGQAELAARSVAAEHMVQQNLLREHAGVAAQRVEFAKTFAPLIENAKRVVADVRAFNHKNGSTLRRLAGLSGWKNVNAAWPVELRLKFQSQVILPAEELVRHLDTILMFNSRGENLVVAEAEEALRHWAPGAHVADISMHVGRLGSDDVMRNLRNAFEALNLRYSAIEEQGREYVGQPIPEVIVLLPGSARQGAVEDILAKNTPQQQTHVTGMGVIDPSDRNF